MEIAVAALRVFQKKGFSRTRVADICAEAGIAKGTYYIYFSTREEVLVSLFSLLMTRSAETIERSKESDDPVSAVVGLISDLIDDGAAHMDTVPLFWEVAGNRIVQSRFSLNRRIGELFTGLAKKIETMLTRGKIAGTVRPEIDIPAFARMITSAVDGVVLHAALFGAEALAEQKSQLVNMVRTYLGHTDKAKGA